MFMSIGLNEDLVLVEPRNEGVVEYGSFDVSNWFGSF